jgi:hypothetical protein
VRGPAASARPANLAVGALDTQVPDGEEVVRVPLAAMVLDTRMMVSDSAIS